jgi:hypothetical protein
VELAPNDVWFDVNRFWIERLILDSVLDNVVVLVCGFCVYRSCVCCVGIFDMVIRYLLMGL